MPIETSLVAVGSVVPVAARSWVLNAPASRTAASGPFFFQEVEFFIKTEQRCLVERKSARFLFLGNTPQHPFLQATHAAFFFLHVVALSRTTDVAFASAPLLLLLYHLSSTASSRTDKKRLLSAPDLQIKFELNLNMDYCSDPSDSPN